MSHHTITVKELRDWVDREVWHDAACSHGNGASKTLEMSNGGAFRVTDHGQVTYLGFDMGEAVGAYNAAP